MKSASVNMFCDCNEKATASTGKTGKFELFIGCKEEQLSIYKVTKLMNQIPVRIVNERK